jgi:hypothetical protein
MVNLSEISVEDIFRGLIVDSLSKDGFITQQPPPQSSESFFSRHKFFIGTMLAGVALGPAAFGGLVATLGFGEAGIAAGSTAAWMMSFYRGYVAAGSLVAILQSVGAAGLGIGGFIAAGAGGGLFAGLIAKLLLYILETNPEGLAELENFVSITNENDETNNTTTIFDMKRQLLVSNENEKLDSFFKGFDLAQQVAKDRTRQFRFLIIENEECVEGSNFLYRKLIDTYGIDRVTSEQGSYFLNLNED